MQYKKEEELKMKKLYSVVVLTALAVLLAAGMSLFASTIDDRIKSSAEKSYVFKTYLNGDDIKIDSKKGVVTLTGTVTQEFHKSLANDTVSGLPGVKRVDNKLEYKGASTDVISDTLLDLKIKTLLTFHSSVRDGRTEVYVKNSIVTLKGITGTQARKELIGEYAKDVDGVKDVKNEMTVVQAAKGEEKTLGENIDDASVTAQVKLTLTFHRSTSKLDAKVSTTKGVVTLSGIAKNQTEKDNAAKLVNDIDGVKSVTNLITIEKSK
jgi:osmotically-inducible protein OsmY